MPLDTVAVLGAGSWGTALAQAAALAGRHVTLIARDPLVAEEVNSRRTNDKALGRQILSERIVGSTDTAAVAGADFVILGVPAQASRAALRGVGTLLGSKPVVLSAKGLEEGTLKRQSEILHEFAPAAVPFVLSGPSFAVDVAAGRPTAVTLAGRDPASASDMAAALAGPTFRPYASDDIVGVELAGALKNVYALACGAVEGAGLGASARSALIARAYAEMARLVGKLGGSVSTLAGLAGLGDLTLSCTSRQSRNYRFGIALGSGADPASAEVAQIGLTEGLMTAPVVQKLAAELGVDVPLVNAVNNLLAGDADIATIVASLMARPLKRED